MVGQSFAMASPPPGILDASARSAAEKGPAMAYKRRLDDRGDLRSPSGRADHRGGSYVRSQPGRAARIRTRYWQSVVRRAVQCLRPRPLGVECLRWLGL